MRLSREAFRRFYELHSWAGVLSGLVLHVMFLAGGFTLFHEQLELWEEPLAQRAPRGPDSLQAQLTRGLEALGTTPSALWFKPGAEPGFDWQDEGGVWKAGRLDSERGVIVAQRERLAHFTYSLHYLWHELTGLWLYTVAGLLALVWLVVLTTGLLVHLEGLASQFHRFRPELRGRPFWSDLHKVLGTMGLPFQAVMAFSGAFIVLGPMILKLFVGPVFAGDESRASQVTEGYPSLEVPPPGALVAVLSVDALDERVRRQVPALEVDAYRLVNHGRDNGRFEAWGHGGGSPRGRILVQLDEVTGAVTAMTDRHASSELRRWIVGLHFAQFGGLSVRVLFLLLTIAASVTILSGNWIWLSRRGSSPRRRLSRLTVGVGAGAWVAFGVLLAASRVLPLSWAGRMQAEELLFFGALLGCVGWAAVARDERKLWWKQLGLAALAWTVTPLLAARLSSAGLFGAGPWVPEVLGVDCGVLAVGIALGLVAVALARRPGGGTSHA